MKARLAPLHFKSGRDTDFVAQLDRLKDLFRDEAEFLEPVALGDTIPDADAVVFPQLLGDAYRQTAAIKSLKLPILILTSEFGTMAMWDWEIASYLRGEGVDTIAPYSVEQAKIVCKALMVKRELKQSTFLVFQDNPGEAGFQPSIFKRFYWWEDECTQRMLDKFGIRIVKKSFKDFGARAQAIDDGEAEAVWGQWQSRLPVGPMPKKSLLSALKVYLAVRQELDRDASIRGVGINCLNESHFSDTTPCLAWNMLYEERGLIWGCEGDTVSMLTKHILHRSLGVPIMMTNLYPFLMGQAALKHERIPRFPEVDEPDNYLLAAHCGYLGVLPQSFATEWALRGKVLAIVNENATAIDARLPVGDLTLAKLDPTFEKLVVAEGTLTGYAQYPGSDCLNGAVIKVADGHKLMAGLPSHHSLLTTGHNLVNMKLVGRVLDLGVEAL
jgi:hypothetical protein